MVCDIGQPWVGVNHFLSLEQETCVSKYDPYQPPPGYGQSYQAYQQPPMSQRGLAGLGKRFLGALVDCLVGFGVAVPGYIFIFAGGALSDGNVTPLLFLLGILWLIVGGFAVLGFQIYLLVTRSQSIGKYVMKTQIVDYHTGQPANFMSCFVLRVLVNSLLAAVPCLGAIYGLVDIFFIFRDDRRCVHDHLATTVVIDLE